MKKLLVYIFLTLPVLLASCVKADDVSINKLESFDISNINKPKITVSVENRSGSKIKVKAGRLALYRGDRELAQIMLEGPVIVPRRSNGNVEIPMRLKIDDMFALISLAQANFMTDPTITVSGELIAKAGAAGKKIKYEKMPLSQFLQTFGIDRKTLESYF